MVAIILIFDVKVKWKKDKRSIFEIHFLFNYGYDSISSEEFHEIGISAYQLPTISR